MLGTPLTGGTPKAASPVAGTIIQTVELDGNDGFQEAVMTLERLQLGAVKSGCFLVENGLAGSGYRSREGRVRSRFLV